MRDAVQVSSSRGRRWPGDVPSPQPHDIIPAHATLTRLLALLTMTALVLSGFTIPVLAQQRSDAAQDLFPANLLLELTDDHISGDGRQIVVMPRVDSRETVDDLLFIERAGRPEVRRLPMGNGDRPKERTARFQHRAEMKRSNQLNR